MTETSSPTSATPLADGVQNSTATASTAVRDGVTDLRNAFVLGATISELQGRIRIGALNTNLGALTKGDWSATSQRASFVPYVEADSDLAWTTSAWRVLFERLSLLHQSFFADSTTDKTRYDPGTKVPPYFFPDEPNYADIGIAPAPVGKEVLANFKLREVTRRGLNCLTLLLINPEVSLLPEEVATEQARLIELMAGVSNASSPPQPTSQPPSSNSDEASRDTAISVIAKALLMYLHAWEGFLRESFFAAGISRHNENNVIAFEAGLSVAWLSWGITVQNLDDADALRELWTTTFADGGISRLQHQVAVLCQAIDDARAERAEDASARSRAAGQAVKRSLDYWQRAVMWLAKRPAADVNAAPDKTASTVPALDADDWKRLRIALVEQTGIWQALVLEQQSLDTFTARGVTQKILQDVAASFQHLATMEGVFGAATEVSKTVVAEAKFATSQIEAVAQQTIGVAQRTMGAVLRSFWPVIAVLAVVVLVGLLVLVQHVSTGSSGTLLADMTTPVTAAVGAVVLFFSQRRAAADVTRTIDQANASTPRPQASPPQDGNSFSDVVGGLTGRVEAIAGQVGSTVLTAFDRGFEKVQDDLGELGHSIGVSYPLVEYFVLNEAWNSFRADIDFMEQVIWDETDRRDEIVRVASAAFGPIGAFALSTVTVTSGAPKGTA